MLLQDIIDNFNPVHFGITVLLIYISASFLNMIFRSNKFPVDGRTVLITGGSQGMGKSVAQLLASKGANVIIVARTVAKLEEAIKSIKAAAKSPSQRFHYISADVTSVDENTRILAEATQWNNDTPPDIVWANAGTSAPQLFLDAPLETLRSQMDVNYWAAAYLARATLALWLKTPSKTSDSANSKKKLPRHLVMTSSTIAFVGLAGYAPYAPAKSALRSLHDTLRSELALYNGAFSAQPASSRPPAIKIATVFPGTILSPGYDNENILKHPVTKELEKTDPKQTEDQVAAASVRKLERGSSIIATQFLVSVMRASALGGSIRDRPVIDTLLGWVASVAFLFVAPDMERTVWKWGVKNGVPRHDIVDGVKSA